MKCWFLLFIISCSVQAAQTGYRLVHPDGTVEFSDQPLPAGEKIELREAPTTQFVPPAPPAATQPRGKKGAAADAGLPGKIRIISPASGETLWFDESGVTVAVAVTPPLREGEKIAITLDGRVVASGTGNGFNLGVLYRGSHTLSAAIITASGAVVSSSAPVTFHIRQRSSIKRTPPPDSTPTP
jgi:hypothetical protein